MCLYTGVGKCKLRVKRQSGVAMCSWCPPAFAGVVLVMQFEPFLPDPAPPLFPSSEAPKGSLIIGRRGYGVDPTEQSDT